MGKPTAGECVQWPVPHNITEVKEHIRYHIDGLPFTTARKIYHLRCDTCKGGVSLDLNKEFTADLAKNRAFILEQDKLYTEYTSDGPMIMLNRGPTVDYTAPRNTKHWHKGIIHYLRFHQTGDSVRIVPSSVEFTVYCNEQDTLRFGVAQFVKPDDYFKLTSINVNQPIKTTFS